MLSVAKESVNKVKTKLRQSCNKVNSLVDLLSLLSVSLFLLLSKMLSVLLPFSGVWLNAALVYVYCTVVCNWDRSD
jgi:hypothetical protein